MYEKCMYEKCNVFFILCTAQLKLVATTQPTKQLKTTLVGVVLLSVRKNHHHHHHVRYDYILGNFKAT